MFFIKKKDFNKEKFISDYNKIKSSRLMAKKSGCSTNWILDYAQEINYVNNTIQRQVMNYLKFIMFLEVLF